MKKFFIQFTIAFAFMISIFSTASALEQSNNSINLVYPMPNSCIKASSTFFVGSTNAKASLKINSNQAKVWDNGSFVEVVPLKPGKNTFLFESILNNKKVTKTVTLTRANARKELSCDCLDIDESYILPNKNITLKTQDIFEVQFRGTSAKDFKGKTPLSAYFKIGDTIVKMKEMPEAQAKMKGIYRGSYKIKDTDDFDKTPVTIIFETEGQKIEKTVPTLVSTIDKDFFVVGKVKTDLAVVREFPNPNKDRLSPMLKGSIVVADGEYGDYYRIKLSPTRTVWMLKKDIEMTKLTDCPPIGDLSKINIYSDESAMYVVIPLEYQTPILIKNTTPNKIELNIYGLKKNILSKDPKFIKNNAIDITYSQPDDTSAKIEISTAYKNLWGYDYYFKGKNLIVEIVKEPSINPQKPLENIIVAIDAGHGGSEKGSVGPTGVAEKDINLQISKYLEQELKNAGAKVVMTRSEDVETEIYSRVDIANHHKALLLLSIHNNALPDGQNPYITHGTSAYYYHPQAIELAKIIQRNLSSDLKLQSNGVFRQSLVLARPTKPLSVLVETAFMINPEEYAKLLDDNFKRMAAKSLKKSIEDYVKSAVEK